jgi:hypothetical protein
MDGIFKTPGTSSTQSFYMSLELESGVCIMSQAGLVKWWLLDFVSTFILTTSICTALITSLCRGLGIKILLGIA